MPTQYLSTDPNAGEPVESAGGGYLSTDPNAGAAPRDYMTTGTNALRSAGSLSATPWYSQGMFAGHGPSVTDIIDTAPAIGGAIGGALGAGSGAFAGLGFGAVPGAVGGAAIGGEGGEAVRQIARSAIGAYSPRTMGEAATNIGQQGGIQVASELTGRALPVVFGKGVSKLLPAGEKQYAQALGATTVANKQLSEKIVPELIKRRVSGSREAIAELADKKIAESGAALDAALANVPKGTAADVGGVLNHLQQLKRQYVVPSNTPGVNTIVDQAAYNNLGELQKIVATTKPTFESVRRLRQILDEQVTKGDKTFGRTISEGSKIDATREAANAIRSELAKVAPDVAKVNKEFSFWKNVDRVVNATIDRTKAQAQPLGQQIAQGIATPAVIAGALTGGTGGSIAAGTAAAVALRRVVQSPQWRTWSAVQKDRLAEAIASGDAQRVSALLSHAGTAGWTAPDDQP